MLGGPRVESRQLDMKCLRRACINLAPRPSGLNRFLVDLLALVNPMRVDRIREAIFGPLHAVTDSAETGASTAEGGPGGE